MLVIVGAGIGGLTLAAVLERAGIPVRVVEQSTAFRRVGTGIGLAPNATKALRRLGVLDRLERLAYRTPYRSNREWDTGRELLRLPVGDAMERRYGAPYLLLHRGDLHQALYESVDPEIVEFGRRVDSVKPADAGVQIRYTDGTYEVAEAVIGADGVHSAVRQSIFGADRVKFTGRVAYRSVFPVDLLREPLLDPHAKWWGPDRHIVIYYISAGREVYFTTSVPHKEWLAESFSMAGSTNELKEAFAGFHSSVRAVLDVCPSVQKWAIFERDPLPSWRSGPVVLLGDACHPMTPYMQQGAATAIEDAVILARCVMEAGLGDLEAAFRVYESCRHERATAIQLESSKNRWNKVQAGAPEITHDFVYSYDAWSAPLVTSQGGSR